MTSRHLALLVLLFSLLGSGCADTMSVRHLPRTPWTSSEPQTLHMKYLHFQYRMVQVEEDLGIMGEAFPVVEKLPGWASWYGQIHINVYVTDKYGKVLASAEKDLLPRTLDREGPLPIEVRIPYSDDLRQPLYVTFGYNLVFTSTPDASTETKRLVATENALTE